MTPLLTVEDLHVTFNTLGKKLYAVRGVSFTVEDGEAVGIVGESGSGKSTVAQSVHRLTPGEVSGKISLDGKEITSPTQSIGMVFQDPMTSLNPTMKIGAQIMEGMIYHKLASHKEAQEKTLELLKLVGISEPKTRMQHYPHQLSGGMRQRVLIAMALACNPRLLIADEPTSALDVTIQAQILDLLKKMQSHFQMGLLLISHDFGVIASLCKKILVMYAGKIVESGPVNEILKRPKHPYTQMLLSCLPRLDQPTNQRLTPIEGSPPNLFTLPQGCAFKERCPHAAWKCEEEPKGPVACWRALYD